MIHPLLVIAAAAGALSLALVAVNLALTPRLSRVRVADAAHPRVSIVIPARNEERSIEAAVTSHLAQAYSDFEVLVVEDRSSDRTAEILASIARENPQLTVIAGADPPAGWLGKPHALHQGARAAKGALLLFADADVVYRPGALAEAVAHLEERRADLLALLPRLEAEGFWENVLMPFVLGAYFLGPGFLANWDRPRWLAVGGGAGNLIRRSAYDALGGHEALRDSVIDDVRLALKAKRAGFRTRAVRAEDRVTVRMYRGFREVCDGFTKNMAYAFNGALGVFLFASTAFNILIAIAPALVLAAALLGARLPGSDLALAAVAYGLAVLARLLMAQALKERLWPAFTHPFMLAVWAGIIGRSLYHRIVRRRLTWRGREFDARTARF
jgi:chlorobactene glucosyltransferase